MPFATADAATFDDAACAQQWAHDAMVALQYEVPQAVRPMVLVAARFLDLHGLLDHPGACCSNPNTCLLCSSSTSAHASDGPAAMLGDLSCSLSLP